MDIISRVVDLFDRVIVGILHNADKKAFFSIAQKIDFLQQCTKRYANVEIIPFDGMLVEFAKQQQAKFIVRGLRAVSDFEYEFQIASVNNRLQPDVETLFLMTRTEHAFLSSSIVREIGSYGGDISSMVPPEILEKLQKELLRK